jgi:SsrA-binding protein
MNIQNRKARFEYHILKEYVAGLQLFGSEVKSTKNNDASIIATTALSQDHHLEDVR